MQQRLDSHARVCSLVLGKVLDNFCTRQPVCDYKCAVHAASLVRRGLTIRVHGIVIRILYPGNLITQRRCNFCGRD